MTFKQGSESIEGGNPAGNLGKTFKTKRKAIVKAGRQELLAIMKNIRGEREIMKNNKVREKVNGRR